MVRKDRLTFSLLLPKRFEEAINLDKIEKFGGYSYGHYFKIRKLDDLDIDFMDLSGCIFF